MKELKKFLFRTIADRNIYWGIATEIVYVIGLLLMGYLICVLLQELI